MYTNIKILVKAPENVMNELELNNKRRIIILSFE